MEEQLAAAKRKTQAFGVHKQADMGNIGMKAIVQKLNGDPKSKFEVDHKMTAEQFHKLLTVLSQPELAPEDEPVDSAALYEQYCSAFQKALCDAAEPFKGDLENVTYKNILAQMRAFDPNAPTTD